MVNKPKAKNVPCEADVRVHRGLPVDGRKSALMVRAQVKELRSEGMTWLRVTYVFEHNYVVVEGWRKRPAEEAPFDPHLTAAPRQSVA